MAECPRMLAGAALRMEGGQMRVYVAGATGAIGKRLIPQLVAAGHQVTAATRSSAKVVELRRLGAVPVVVDGLDVDAVTKAVASAKPDAIVHQWWHTDRTGRREC